MITVDVEQVKAVINDDTETMKYIEYATLLSQALGLTNYKITNDLAWHPSNLPAPRPMQKKQTGKEWHQEALECGYYTNAGTPHPMSKSLLGELQKALTDTTGYQYGMGGADYQYLYDTIVENPLSPCFHWSTDRAVQLHRRGFLPFLRTIGCLALPDKRTTPYHALNTILPVTMFADEKNTYWMPRDVEGRFEQLGVDDLLPTPPAEREYDGDVGAPAFTIEDIENLDVNKIMGSPVGKAYTNGFANLSEIIAKNNAAKEALEAVIPLLTADNQETEQELDL